jgi:sugar/nucleoside kinase (ribokinase family)
MARYLTLGNVLVEDVALPDGRELPGRLGGDALYAAIGARAFADDAQLVARVGRGFPPRLVRALEDAGFGPGLIRSRRAAVRLRIDWGVEGRARFTFQERSGTYEDATPVPDEIPPSLTHRLEAVHLAPVPFGQMEQLLRWARPRARLVTLDPHYEHVDGTADKWREVLPLVDAFLPSKDEAAALLGGWPEPEAAPRALAALGAPLVCVKLGAEGSIGYRAAGAEIVRMPAASTDPVDPTGCGDAFCGGFLGGLAEFGSLHAALAYGAVAASLAGEDHGAQHALTVDREEARRRLATLVPLVGTSRPPGVSGG